MPEQLSDDFPDDLIDDEEASRDLCVKTSTLASWRSTGKKPDFYKIGRVIRYSRRINAQWKAKQRHSPRQTNSVPAHGAVAGGGGCGTAQSDT
jgi:hypothetical protein